MKVLPLGITVPAVAPERAVPSLQAARMVAGAAITRPHRQPAAITVLALGGLATAVLAVCALRAAGEAALSYDDAQQLVAAAAGIGALLLARRAGDAEQRRIRGALAAALVLGSVGFLIWDSAHGLTTALVAADAFFLVATAIVLIGVGGVIFRGLDRGTLIAVVLDAVIFCLAVISAVMTVWHRDGGPAGGEAPSAAILGAVVLYSGAAAGLIGLVHRRVHPSMRGPWAVIIGVYAIASSWLFWLDAAGQGGALAVTPADVAFSAGVLVTAYGGVTWTTARTGSLRYERFARRAGDLFPIIAVLVAVALEVLPRRAGGIDSVTLFASSTVLAAMARQALLLRAERRARAAERRASARLAHEIEERAATIVTLSRLESADTPEATAHRICAEALRLDGIDYAVIRAFDRAGQVIPLAFDGIDIGGTLVPGQPIEATRGDLTIERAAAGPWVEILAPGSATSHLGALHAAGLRGTANAPMYWDDRLIGAVGLGTRSPDAAASLFDRLPTVREFGVVAAAHLGPALAARERLAQVRQDLQGVIDEGAFRPVFQVICELASGRTVGFEALTRFADGTRPDHKFHEAAKAGLGLELEMACLAEQVRAATALPPDAWLSLNVSPALAMTVAPLLAILRRADREVVLEITEHNAIQSYDRLAKALSILRGHARLAVDDAGAGYAGLRHILEVQPEFVKLDISLVRAVDTDPARRAMIGSMISFAREAGCVLLAEGIETPGELATLQRLGVSLGQGYLLGRPGPVSLQGG